MFEKTTWLDVLLMACIVGFIGFSIWFVGVIKAYRRETDAEKLVSIARSKLRSGGNRERVLAGLAYLAQEKGVDKEVEQLWGELDK